MSQELLHATWNGNEERTAELLEPAMLIELKYDKSGKTAAEQINKKI